MDDELNRRGMLNLRTVSSDSTILCPCLNERWIIVRCNRTQYNNNIDGRKRKQVRASEQRSKINISHKKLYAFELLGDIEKKSREASSTLIGILLWKCFLSHDWSDVFFVFFFIPYRKNVCNFYLTLNFVSLTNMF